MKARDHVLGIEAGARHAADERELPLLIRRLDFRREDARRIHDLERPDAEPLSRARHSGPVFGARHMSPGNRVDRGRLPGVRNAEHDRTRATAIACERFEPGAQTRDADSIFRVDGERLPAVGPKVGEPRGRIGGSREMLPAEDENARPLAEQFPEIGIGARLRHAGVCDFDDDIDRAHVFAQSPHRLCHVARVPLDRRLFGDRPRQLSFPICESGHTP